MVVNNSNSVPLALTDKDMKDPEPFLKTGERWKIDYDFFIMIRERVRGFFRRCNMDIYVQQCVSTHAYPATIEMLNTMDPRFLNEQSRILLSNAKKFSDVLHERLCVTVDSKLLKAINRRSVKSGFATWAFIEGEMTRKNADFDL